MRTNSEIDEEIKRLTAIRDDPSVRKDTPFSETDEDVIQAQIDVLTDDWSHEDIESQRDLDDWDERVFMLVEDAYDWMVGESEDLPSTAWLTEVE